MSDLKCNLCDYSTSRLDNLTRHIDINHKNKLKRPDDEQSIKKKQKTEHQCPDCPYNTSDKSHFNRHVQNCKRKGTKRKTNDDTDNNCKRQKLDLKCTYCDYVGRDRFNLERHEKLCEAQPEKLRPIVNEIDMFVPFRLSEPMEDLDKVLPTIDPADEKI